MFILFTIDQHLGLQVFCVCPFRVMNGFELVSLHMCLKFLCGLYPKGEVLGQRKWASSTLTSCQIDAKQLCQFAFHPAAFGSSSCSIGFQTANVVRIEVLPVWWV